MRKLRMGGWEGNWIDRYGAQEIRRLSRLFPGTNDVDTSLMNDVQVGAYVWARKCQALEVFQAAGLRVYPVRYEDILGQPEATMRSVMSFLDLEWEDQVIQYHNQRRNQGRVLAGGTRGSSALNKSRLESDTGLSDEEILLIHDVCHPWMRKYQYEIN